MLPEMVSGSRGMHHLKYFSLSEHGVWPNLMVKRNCPPLNGHTMLVYVFRHTHIIIGYISHSTSIPEKLHGDEIPLKLVGEIRIPT